MKPVVVTLVLAALVGFGCSGEKSKSMTEMDRIAESYVKLALNLDVRDPGYVDAYYGPAEWKPKDDPEDSAVPSLEKMRAEADSLLDRLDWVSQKGFDELHRQRVRFLEKQLISLRARVDMDLGKKLTFDEESRALYDAVAPRRNLGANDSLLAVLDGMLPGDGPLWKRYDDFRSQFLVPPDKREAVTRAALDECRKRTLEHITLPKGESFDMEFVQHQPWGAYNWYKGNYHSLIQFNTDLPTYISGVLAVTSHEGYPGHHVYNVLLEEKLYHGQGFVEYCVYPLYSPQSLIAEGTANVAIDMLFTPQDRNRFEKTKLFPIAGLDTTNADTYFKVRKIINELHSGTTIARDYLDGRIDKETAIEQTMKYGLRSRARAEKSVEFDETYRSYVINYSLGKDRIEEYMKSRIGDDPTPEEKWNLFETILSSPLVPSKLVAKDRESVE